MEDTEDKKAQYSGTSNGVLSFGNAPYNPYKYDIIIIFITIIVIVIIIAIVIVIIIRVNTPLLIQYNQLKANLQVSVHSPT